MPGLQISFWDSATSFSPQLPQFSATGINVEVAHFAPHDFLHLFVGDQVLELNCRADKFICSAIYCKKQTKKNNHFQLLHVMDPHKCPWNENIFGTYFTYGVSKKKSSIRSYWATSVLHATPVFATVMPWARYETLMRFMHFSNNSQVSPKTDPGYDRLNKCNPLISLLQKCFLHYYTPDQNLSVDEYVMSFKGRLTFCQFIPSKRARYGIKLYKMCESTTGYTCIFFFYIWRKGPPT